MLHGPKWIPSADYDLEGLMTPRQLLLENNPFYSGSAGNPWDNVQPDVESVNCDAYEGVLRLLRHKISYPDEPVAALVLGEAGAGKTHLLKRILDATRAEEQRALFATVRPILRSHAPLRHLIQELAIELARPIDDLGIRSQWDLITAEIVHERLRGQPEGQNAWILPELEKDPLFLFSRNVNQPALRTMAERAIKWMAATDGRLQRRFLNVLIRYSIPQDGERRIAQDWLKGDILDEEDSRRLGVPSRSGDSDDSLENEAREIIVSCGDLTARYGIAATVCFDQLDNLRRDEEIHAFERMVHVLVNDSRGLLPIAFARGDSWEKRFRTALDPAVCDRLRGNTFVLSNCTLEEAKELIRRRVESRIEGEEGRQAADWLLDQAEPRLAEGRSPRMVVQIANMALSEKPKAVDVVDVLAEAFRNECDEISVDFESWPPDDERLLRALRTYFVAKKIEMREFKESRFVRFTTSLPLANGDSVRSAFLVNTAQHPLSVAAQFKQAIAFLNANPGENPGAICYYISDARCKFPAPPKWPKCNELRKEIGHRGGRVLFLEHAEARRWYALFSLECKIREGDLSYIDSEGRACVVQEDDLHAFLASDRLTPPLLSFDDKTDRQPLTLKEATPSEGQAKASEHTIPVDLEEVTRIIASAPMNMLSIDLIVERMNIAGNTISPEVLLECLGKRKSRFQVFPNKQGATVMLK